MVVQTLSMRQFVGLLKESFQIGKKNYPILFIASLIILAVTLVADMNPIGSSLGAIFVLLWSPGVIYVAQTMVEDQTPPKLGQFFVVFTKSTVFKRLLPSILINIIVTAILVFIFSMVILSIYVSIKSLPDLSADQAMALPTISLDIGLITSMLLLVVSLPLNLFLFVMLLQDRKWQESLKISMIAVAKNFWFYFFFIAFPIFSILLVMVYYHTTSFTPDSGLAFQENLEWLKHIQSGLGILVGPFFFSAMYLMYKGTVSFDKPDDKISALS